MAGENERREYPAMAVENERREYPAMAGENESRESTAVVGGILAQWLMKAEGIWKEGVNKEYQTLETEQERRIYGYDK